MPISSYANFLEKIPPSQLYKIEDIGFAAHPISFLEGNVSLNKSDIRLYCNNENCNGIRFFRCIDNSNKYPKTDDYSFIYVEYQCSNCRTSKKTYSLAVLIKEDENDLQRGNKIGLAYKSGELPVFGPITPSKLFALIGSDKELFLKGRRCESQGLGIAAFSYYRRVVESQKNRILNEIIKVAERISNEQEVIQQMKLAMQESQFTKSLAIVKAALPQSLLINGHNPLLLLHSALSEGLHGHTDEECLSLATSIRIVLSELSERLAQALKDDSEVSQALQTLISKKTSK